MLDGYREEVHIEIMPDVMCGARNVRLLKGSQTMKNDPNAPRDKGKSRESKAELNTGAPTTEHHEGEHPKRLHLLEHRGHRWARRNAHV